MSIKVHLNKGLGFYFCGRIALYPAEHVVGYPKELDITSLTDNEILGLEHGSHVGAIRIVEGYEELLAKAKQLKGEEEPKVEESKVEETEEVEPVKEDKTEEVNSTENTSEEDTSEQSDESTEEDKTKPATTRRRTKRTATTK